MTRCSGRILLALTGLLCLLTQGFGAILPQDSNGEGSPSLTIDQVLMKAAQEDADVPSVPIDQVLLKAEQDDAQENGPFYFSEHTHMIRREFDMIFTLEEWLDVQHGRQKRTAAIVPGKKEKRWKKNVVNFELQSGSFSTDDKKEIYRAVRDIAHYTCLTMKETSSARDRILVQKGDGGCYSRVGMVGGVQELGLSSACRLKRIVIHEFLHAIGIHHEQTRPDRDDHVDVRLEHIRDSLEYNFEKYDWNYINNYSLPYDYLSVMHYGPYAFTQNGEYTIVTHNSKYQRIIGTNPGLSLGDIRTLNSMHNCVPDTCTLTEKVCKSQGGWVGKDCKCWCEGEDPKKTPVEYCSAEDVKENGSLNDCKDLNDDCAYWKDNDSCNKSENWAFMFTNCAKSCNTC